MYRTKKMKEDHDADCFDVCDVSDASDHDDDESGVGEGEAVGGDLAFIAENAVDVVWGHDDEMNGSLALNRVACSDGNDADSDFNSTNHHSEQIGICSELIDDVQYDSSDSDESDDYLAMMKTNRRSMQSATELTAEEEEGASSATGCKHYTYHTSILSND